MSSRAVPAADAAVDIVVPYAGSAALLREAVESVRGQTDPRWRLTVVEDGPQDASVGPWLRGLGDPRIRYEQNARQLGVGGNFQRCLDLATATWVVFLGCDDRMLDRYVEVVQGAVERHPDVDLIQPGVRVIDAVGATVTPLGDRVKARIAPRATGDLVVHGEPLMTSFLHGIWTYFPSLCWRREAISAIGFRQDLPTTLDVALLGALVLQDRGMVLLKDVVFEYRRHASSASSIAALRTERFDEEREVFAELADDARARGWRRAARAGRMRATSRLHAATMLPAAVRRNDRRAQRALLRHVFGR